MLKFCQNFEYTQSMSLMLKEDLKRDPDTNSVRQSGPGKIPTNRVKTL